MELRKRILSGIGKYTSHENIFLTKRGNKAIDTALRIIKEFNKKILVPDQGSWLTYSQYAKRLNLETRLFPTNLGVIDINVLKKSIEESAALIYSNPAGYYAEQPVSQIHDLCRKNRVTVILDATGCIGSDFHFDSDIAVCSFGRWKPVNLGYGGFISVKDGELCEKNRELLESLEFDDNYLPSLYKKLKKLKKRYERFEEINKKIKNDLKEFDILHKNKRGVNTIVKYNNLEEKKQITDYCEKNKYEFVICPKPIRVNESAISIEVKRIE